MIEEMERADFNFRKIGECRKKIAELEEYYAREKARLDEWLQAERKGYDEEIEFHSNEVIALYQGLRESDPKAKLCTQHGKVASRRSTKYSYDDAVLLEYLKANDLPYIRTKEEIDKAALKKSLSPAADGRLVDVNGSVVDGVSYTEEISYSVSAEV